MLVQFFTCLRADCDANPLLRIFALANCISGWRKKKCLQKYPDRRVERPEQAPGVLPKEGDLILKAMEKHKRLLIKKII